MTQLILRNGDYVDKLVVFLNLTNPVRLALVPCITLGTVICVALRDPVNQPIRLFWYEDVLHLRN